MESVSVKKAGYSRIPTFFYLIIKVIILHNIPIPEFLSSNLGMEDRILAICPSITVSVGMEDKFHAIYPSFTRPRGHGRQISCYMPIIFSFPWAWKTEYLLYAQHLLFPWAWKKEFLLYAHHLLVRVGMEDRILAICPSFTFFVGMTSRIFVLRTH